MMFWRNVINLLFYKSVKEFHFGANQCLLFISSNLELLDYLYKIIDCIVWYFLVKL